MRSYRAMLRRALCGCTYANAGNGRLLASIEPTTTGFGAPTRQRRPGCRSPRRAVATPGMPLTKESGRHSTEAGTLARERMGFSLGSGGGLGAQLRGHGRTVETTRLPARLERGDLPTTLVTCGPSRRWRRSATAGHQPSSRLTPVWRARGPFLPTSTKEEYEQSWCLVGPLEEPVWLVRAAPRSSHKRLAQTASQ